MEAPTSRAQEMVQRARFATKVAILFTTLVLIVLPLQVGAPEVAVVGAAMLAVLLTSLRYTEGHATAYAVCLQLVYCLSLGGLVYAVFVLGLDPDGIVSFAPIVVLGCAYILGWRAALFWSIPCLAIMAGVAYLPTPPERVVEPTVDFLVRSGSLLTVLAFAVSFRRSHDRQAAELAHLAGTDPLTGLSNRLALEAAIERALARATRFGRRGGLVFIDLDGMKQVNDTHGHDCGDAYLREVAARIRSVSRTYDTLARLGGDEFVVLLSETQDPSGTEAYARKLMGVLLRPVDVAGVEITPGASIGIARFPEDADTATALLGAADTAMYTAKQAGGNRVEALSG